MLCGRADEEQVRDLTIRDAEITAHAEFRKHLYDHDVVPEARAAALELV